MVSLMADAFPFEQAERKAVHAKSEFERVTKLVKIELHRFDMERVEDFKRSLEAFLEGMITRQKEASALSMYLSVQMLIMFACLAVGTHMGGVPEHAVAEIGEKSLSQRFRDKRGNEYCDFSCIGNITYDPGGARVESICLLEYISPNYLILLIKLKRFSKFLPSLLCVAH
jgi:hypothetical protein